ncbi:Methyltransferase domain/ubiE/COQ5 methyltransferase family, putative [Leishmania lindenbergi]|uniref:Methyltransferase domain/ubiE/COQ5 methyltransferase family n=1 Tax=Leishmania lindenbergi TaxID=651832 RepID=A0AAW2ZUL0_9TRYP
MLRYYAASSRLALLAGVANAGTSVLCQYPRWSSSNSSSSTCTNNGTTSSSTGFSSEQNPHHAPGDGAEKTNESAFVKDAVSNSSATSEIQKRHRGFIEPSDDVVMETARKALAREGRDEIPEAIVWNWETTAPPILARGKQNIYDFTDDIPQHVKPFWYHEYYQQREYFQLQRQKRPLKERMKMWAGVLAAMAAAGAALTFFRVWVEQPREIRQLREELLQHTYGRVLELAAGHGQNIGAYPYAVHEVVLTDSNPQQLQAMRYRIPHTAYPKYDVKRVRSESLDIFKDNEFDCVVDMFGLCHLRDPVMTLRQMQRVVKPSGMILLLEHGASPYPPVNWFLDYFAQQHNVNTHGCKWNSPIRQYLQESRLEVKEIRNMHYGTTYYVVAYPEVLEAYKDHETEVEQVSKRNKSK